MCVINLRSYLGNVYDELKNYLETLTHDEKNRFMKEVSNFFYNGVADYGDRNMVAFYVLRYARAYGFQFSRAYADIFADMKDPGHVSAVSIGCGTGIDYWGMSYAARKMHRADNCVLDYTGIDPEVWAHNITGSDDMPECDTVRFNKFVQANNTDAAACSNFGQLLDSIEKEPGRALDDIYFFPHSTKEVCIHTVPDCGQEDGKYNAYQSMARFAGIISRKIKDKPVYIAFTYRKKPGNFSNEGVDTAAYETMYGTYLRKCLLERGLDVQMLSPVHVDEENCDLSICSPDEESWNYFYDYEEFHSYTGTNGEITYVADLGKDTDSTFDKLFTSQNLDTRLASFAEWEEVTSNTKNVKMYPMDNLKDMCYQVFKITGRREEDQAQTDKNTKLDIIEKIMRDFYFVYPYTDRSKRSLSWLVQKIHDYPWRADIRDRSFDIFEEIAGYRPDNLWGIQNMINYDLIEDRLRSSGYFIQKFDSDGNVISCEVTGRGKLMGFRTDDDAPGEIFLNTFAQQYVLAGIICGELANL